jgi:hypothetical protein
MLWAIIIVWPVLAIVFGQVASLATFPFYGAKKKRIRWALKYPGVDTMLRQHWT